MGMPCIHCHGNTSVLTASECQFCGGRLHTECVAPHRERAALHDPDPNNRAMAALQREANRTTAERFQTLVDAGRIDSEGRALDVPVKPAPSLICEMSDIPNTAAGRAFRGAMRGRLYGPEALGSAWAWFLKGWDEVDYEVAPVAPAGIPPDVDRCEHTAFDSRNRIGRCRLEHGHLEECVGDDNAPDGLPLVDRILRRRHHRDNPPAPVPSDYERLRLCETILRYAWDNERTGHFDFDGWAEACRLLLGSKSKPWGQDGEQFNQIMIQVRHLAASATPTKFCGMCGEVIEPGHVGALDAEPVPGYCSEFCREAKTFETQRLLDLAAD